MSVLLTNEVTLTTLNEPGVNCDQDNSIHHKHVDIETKLMQRRASHTRYFENLTSFELNVLHVSVILI